MIERPLKGARQSVTDRNFVRLAGEIAVF